jgi:hypothetical protein
MPSTERLDLRALRAAAVDADGAVVPLPSLVAGTLTWPGAHAHRILHAWRDWLAATDGVVRSGVRLVRAPRRAPVVALDVALAGEPWGAGRALGALRRLEPQIDSIRLVAPAAIALAAERVPPGTTPVAARLRLRALPADAVDAFHAAAADAALLSAGVERLGGGFAVTAVGAGRGPEDLERARLALAQLGRRLAPLDLSKYLLRPWPTRRTPRSSGGSPSRSASPSAART